MNTIHTTPPSSVDIFLSLMPEDNQQENFIPKFWLFRLFGSRENVRRAISLEYNDWQGKVSLCFRTKPKKGLLFVDRARAEKWFRGKIEVSPHFGEKVVVEVRPLYQQFHCEACQYTYQFSLISRRIHGPQSLVRGMINIPTAFGGMCPYCEGWTDMMLTTEKLEKTNQEKKA